MVTEFWAGAAAMAAGATPVGTSLPLGCTPRKTAATIIAVMPRVPIRRMLLPPPWGLALPCQYSTSVGKHLGRDVINCASHAHDEQARTDSRSRTRAARR